MKNKLFLRKSDFITVWTVTNKLKQGQPVSDYLFDKSIKILDDFNPDLTMDNLNEMSYYYESPTDIELADTSKKRG